MCSFDRVEVNMYQGNLASFGVQCLSAEERWVS